MSRKPARSSKKHVLNRTTKRRIGRILVVAGLLLISVFTLSAYSFYKYLNQQIVLADSAGSASFATDKAPAILYLQLEDLSYDKAAYVKGSLIIFDKSSKKVINLEISPELSINVYGKFSSEQFKKIPIIARLEALQNQPTSNTSLDTITNYFEESAKNLFGYKISRIVVVDSQASEKLEKFWKTGSIAYILDPSVRAHLKTSLSLKEFYGLGTFINSIPSDRHFTQVIDDNIRQDTIDELLRDITYDSDFALENKSVAVLNGTNIDGVATFGSRVVKNFGGHVTSTANTDKLYDKSYIICDDPNSQTVKTLSDFFKIPTVIQKKDATKFTENEIYRSDIVLILGFDTALAL